MYNPELEKGALMAQVQERVVGQHSVSVRWLTTLTLPHNWRQWTVVAILVTVILFVGLFLSGMHTGRLGFVPVEGNSMSSVFPWGTAVFVIPVEPREGDYVVAWGRLADPEIEEDSAPTLMTKQYKNGSLVSTDSRDHSTDFELRGVVIAQLPIQKIFPWMDKGAQTHVVMSSARLARLEEKRQEQRRKQETLKRLYVERGELATSAPEPATDLNRTTSVFLEANKPLTVDLAQKSTVSSLAVMAIEAPPPSNDLELAVQVGDREVILPGGMNDTELERPQEVGQVTIKSNIDCMLYEFHLFGRT